MWDHSIPAAQAPSQGPRPISAPGKRLFGQQHIQPNPFYWQHSTHCQALDQVKDPLSFAFSISLVELEMA